MKKFVVLLVILLLFPLYGESFVFTDSFVEIVKPRNGIYLMDKKVFPVAGQIVIGAVTVEAEASEDIDRVEFMVPPKVGCRPVVIYNDSIAPYSFYWNFSFDGLKDTGFVAMKARGYAGNEYVAEDDIFLIRIFV